MKARHISSNVHWVHSPEPGDKLTWTRFYDQINNVMVWKVYAHGYDKKLFVNAVKVELFRTEKEAAKTIRECRRALKKYMFYYNNMKILGSQPVKFIPMTFFKPEHFAQMEKNHYQTPNRLNERGGLSSEEMIAVLECKAWKDRSKVNNPDQYLDMLVAIMKQKLGGVNVACICPLCKGKITP